MGKRFDTTNLWFDSLYTTVPDIACIMLSSSYHLFVIEHLSHGIIHGDLTTSNILLRTCSSTGFYNDDSSTPVNNSNEICLVLIDFGLAKNSTSAEERAVDLYVLERALISTHPTLSLNLFWNLFMTAYREGHTSVALTAHASEKAVQHTVARLEQVRQRGRKRECFG